MSKRIFKEEDFIEVITVQELLRDDYIKNFARESNEIEGIKDNEAHLIHEKALSNFLKRRLCVGSFIKFVSEIQPNAIIRKHDFCRVYIGGHQAPLASISLVFLRNINLELNRLNRFGTISTENAFLAHNQFEMIHPFTDGNGRAGRALWLWCMIKAGWQFGLSFKHKYYYQTLSYWWESVFPGENK